MKRMRSASTGIDQGSLMMFSHHEDGGPMWTGEGAREIRCDVRFSEPFRSKPVVLVGISLWDLDQKTNTRADLSAENITRHGFDAVFRTWGNTRVARIRVDWTAIGELRDDDDWDID